MTGSAADNIKRMPGESASDRVFFTLLMDHSSVADQTEEHVRKLIDQKLFPSAIGIMKGWFKRKPEDVEVLKSLKAYLLQKRSEVRALKAEYARTYRKNKRAGRIAEACRLVVCKASIVTSGLVPRLVQRTG